MAQSQKNPNEMVITMLNLADKATDGKKDPTRKKNIELCLGLVRKTTRAINKDERVWAFNGTEVHITKQDELIRKAHPAKKGEIEKYFSIDPNMMYQNMAAPGGGSSSSNSQPTGTANGCVPSRSANQVTPPTTGVTARNQPTGTAARTQPTAAAAPTRPPGAASRATQTQPQSTFQIPNPTAAQKQEVALYRERWQNHPYGMHTIWGQVRLDPGYGLGQNPQDLDIHYDTGSTGQGVPTAVMAKLVGSNMVHWNTNYVTIGNGQTIPIQTGKMQLRIFKDKKRTEDNAITDWFNIDARVGGDFALSGGEMRFDTGLTFANLPGRDSPLIVGKHKPAVIWHMLNIS